MDIHWGKATVAVISVIAGVCLIMFTSHTYMGTALVLGPLVVALVFPKLLSERNPYE